MITRITAPQFDKLSGGIELDLTDLFIIIHDKAMQMLEQATQTGATPEAVIADFERMLTTPEPEEIS